MSASRSRSDNRLTLPQRAATDPKRTLKKIGLRETPTVQMNQIHEDLWQTRLETPFAGVQTHAYLLQCTEGNVLLYNTSHADEIRHIAELGGIKCQCLSHRDGTGASLQRIKDQFGSKLICHAEEELLISRSCPVDIIFSERTTRFFDLQVMHTPGHTDGRNTINTSRNS